MKESYIPVAFSTVIALGRNDLLYTFLGTLTRFCCLPEGKSSKCECKGWEGSFVHYNQFIFLTWFHLRLPYHFASDCSRDVQWTMVNNSFTLTCLNKPLMNRYNSPECHLNVCFSKKDKTQEDLTFCTRSVPQICLNLISDLEIKKSWTISSFYLWYHRFFVLIFRLFERHCIFTLWYLCYHQMVVYNGKRKLKDLVKFVHKEMEKAKKDRVKVNNLCQQCLCVCV